jgi:hypothetical protein
MQVARQWSVDSQNEDNLLSGGVNNLYFSQQPSLFSSVEYVLGKGGLVLLLIAAVLSHDTVAHGVSAYFPHIMTDKISVIFDWCNVSSCKHLRLFGLQR